MATGQIEWTLAITKEGKKERPSADLKEYCYVKEKKLFLVRFWSNPSIIYGYLDVTAKMFQGFKEAPSKGKWLHKHLVATKWPFFRHDLMATP